MERLETVRSVNRRESAAFGELVSRLEGAGLLADPPAEARTVAVNDGGPLGVSIGVALARAGWAVHFEDPGPALASPALTYAAGTLATTRQSAAADTVARFVPGADARVGASRADAWVLVSHGAPAIDEAVALMASDTPHLFVVTDERGAVVGPFAIPGASACGLCDGLARASVDPEWPYLTVQLRAPTVAPPLADADVAASIAGVVCGALSSWRAGDARAWLDSAWHVTTQAPPAARSVPPHPDCGCGAAAPVGDEVAARRVRFE